MKIKERSILVLLAFLLLVFGGCCVGSYILADGDCSGKGGHFVHASGPYWSCIR
jgi:hypothetical protein